MHRLSVLILAGVILGCTSDEELPPDLPDNLVEVESVEPAPTEEPAPAAAVEEQVAPNKDTIVQEMEKQMRNLLGMSVARFEDILTRFRSELKALTVPPKIQAVERELINYYRDEEEAYEARTVAITERYTKEMDQVLGFLKPKVWEIAFQLTGTEDVGASYGSRTGYDEVDEVAEATLELIQFRSGRDLLEDEGAHAKTNRLFMDRIYLNDVEGQGRFSVYVSDPMRHFFKKDEDAIAATIAYQRKGLDPSIPLEFRQVVRNRIVRGGTTRYSSDFHWDETLADQQGRLPLEHGPHAESLVVSSVFFPRINTEDPRFATMHDYTAIRDYKTAVLSRKTGRILDCVSWQYKWHISHFGAVSVEKGAQPMPDEDAEVIKALLRLKAR